MNREKILFVIVLAITLLWGGSALFSPYEAGADPEPGALEVATPVVNEYSDLSDGQRSTKLITGEPELDSAAPAPDERNPWIPHSDLLPVQPAVLDSPRSLPTPIVLPPVEPFPMVPWYRNFRFDGVSPVASAEVEENPFGTDSTDEEAGDEEDEVDNEDLLRNRAGWEFVPSEWDVVTFSNGTKWYGTISLKKEQRAEGDNKWMLLLRDDYQELPFYFEKINTANGRIDSAVTWTFAGSEVIRVEFSDTILNRFKSMWTLARVDAEDPVAVCRLIRDFLPLCEQEGYDRAEGLALAVEAMKGAYKVAPTDLDTVLLLGETLHRSFLFDEELALYQKLLESRDPPAIHARIGRIYRKLGLRDMEAEALARALELAPGDTRSRLNRAEALYALRRLDEAMDDFSEVEQAGSPEEQATALEGRARVFLTQGKPAEAVRLLNEAYDVSSRLTLGAARYAMKDFEGAREAFQEAVDQEPQSARGLTLLGSARAHTATDSAQIGEAIEFLTQGRERDALNYYLPPLGIGFAEERRGNTVESVDHYQAAATALPTMPYIHYALGRSYYRDGRYADAREAFVEALKLDYRFLDALIGAGVASLELNAETNPGKWQDARDNFRRALTLEQRAFDGEKTADTRRFLILAHYRLGRTCLTSEDLPEGSRRKEAKSQMEAILVLDDRFVPALNVLGYIAYYEKEVEKALRFFEQAIDLSPESGNDPDKEYAEEMKRRILEAESRRRWLETFDRAGGGGIGNGWREGGPPRFVPKLLDGSVVVSGRWPTGDARQAFLNWGTRDDDLGQRFISMRTRVWSDKSDKETFQCYVFVRSNRGVGTAAGIERTARNTVVLISKSGTGDWERNEIEDEDGQKMKWPDGWSEIRIERVDPEKGVMEVFLDGQSIGRVDVGLRKRGGQSVELGFLWSAGGGEQFEMKVDWVEMELYAK